MPVISMFYGIIVLMYYFDNKQHKLPHIHVKYQDDEAVVTIETGVKCLAVTSRPISCGLSKHGRKFIATSSWPTGNLPQKGRRSSKLNHYDKSLGPRVSDVTAHEDYTLTVAFNNGEIRRFDMQPYLDRGVFRSLRDKEKFMAAHVALDTVVWPGDLDIAPETLYIEGQSV